MHNSAIIEKLRRKGLKNGMSIIYFDSSAKDFYHMVLMEVPVFESLKIDVSEVNLPSLTYISSSYHSLC